MPCALELLSGALGALGGAAGPAEGALSGAGALADAVLPGDSPPINFSDVGGPSYDNGLNWWKNRPWANWRENLFTNDNGGINYVPMPRNTPVAPSQAGPGMNWQPQAAGPRPMDAGEASLRRAAGIPASDASGNWL